MAVLHAGPDTSIAALASGSVVRGAQGDSLWHGFGQLEAWVGEGTWVVVVNAPGFETQSVFGVDVEGGDCGVRTTHITVRLVKQ